MGVVILILGILLTADAAAVTVMLGFELGKLLVLIMGILLILWGAGYKSMKEWHGFKRFLRILMKLGLLYIIGMSCFLAAFGMVSDAVYREDYAVVLGSAVKNSQPMPDLMERLKTTVDYCEKNPNAVIIVSGGQGFDENTAEANVMYSYLVDKGIGTDRIIREDQSHNTRENFKLSNEVTGGILGQSRVVTITNNYHVFRAKLYAKMCGINTHTLSAKTRWYLIPVDYVRESLAMIKLLVYYLPIDAIM